MSVETNSQKDLVAFILDEVIKLLETAEKEKISISELANQLKEARRLIREYK
jgi:hypothetical protein